MVGPFIQVVVGRTMRRSAKADHPELPVRHLEPSCRQILSTRFTFTTQPAAQSSAVIGRQPYRPYLVASGMMSPVRPYRRIARLIWRCVERCCPITRLARGSDTPNLAVT